MNINYTLACITYSSSKKIYLSCMSNNVSIILKCTILTFWSSLINEDINYLR